jgi:hypothetical protein
MTLRAESTRSFQLQQKVGVRLSPSPFVFPSFLSGTIPLSSVDIPTSLNSFFDKRTADFGGLWLAFDRVINAARLTYNST